MGPSAYYMYKEKHQLLYLPKSRAQNQYCYLKNTFQLKITKLSEDVTGKANPSTSLLIKKIKLRPPCDTIIYPPNWLKLKRLATPNLVSVCWYNHFGKHYLLWLKIYPRTQQFYSRYIPWINSCTCVPKYANKNVHSRVVLIQ